MATQKFFSKWSLKHELLLPVTCYKIKLIWPAAFCKQKIPCQKYCKTKVFCHGRSCNIFMGFVENMLLLQPQKEIGPHPRSLSLTLKLWSEQLFQRYTLITDCFHSNQLHCVHVELWELGKQIVYCLNNSFCFKNSRRITSITLTEAPIRSCVSK